MELKPHMDQAYLEKNADRCRLMIANYVRRISVADITGEDVAELKAFKKGYAESLDRYTDALKTLSDSG